MGLRDGGDLVEDVGHEVHTQAKDVVATLGAQRGASLRNTRNGDPEILDVEDANALYVMSWESDKGDGDDSDATEWNTVTQMSFLNVDSLLYRQCCTSLFMRHHIRLMFYQLS